MEIAKYVLGGGGTMVLSAAARALPVPDPDGSKWYGFMYRFIQNLLANFDKAETGRLQMSLRKKP